MANAKIDILGLGGLELVTNLYNQIFKPARDLEFFRRRFKGRMVVAGDDTIEVEVDGRLYRLPIAGIRKAHLAPDF